MENQAKRGRSHVVTRDGRTRSVFDMVEQVFNTVARANGQKELRTVKFKATSFDRDGLRTFIDSLLDDQGGVCALTGVPLHFKEEGSDPDLLCSLDRIDSDGHYDVENLQVVCRFANRWKSNSQDDHFKRLLNITRQYRS